MHHYIAIKIDIVQNELINKLDPDITTQENKC